MLHDFLKKLFPYLPNYIVNALRYLFELLDKQADNSYQDEVYDIIQTAEKLKREFSMNQCGIYNKCNGKVYLLKRIIEELEIAQREEHFIGTALEELQNVTRELSRLIAGSRNKNIKVMNDMISHTVVSKRMENILSQKMSSIDMNALYNTLFAAGTLDIGFTFLSQEKLAIVLSSLNLNLTTTTVLMAGTGILIAAGFTSITFYYLSKHFRNLKLERADKELKNLATELSKIFTVAEELENTLSNTNSDLENYLRSIETALRLFPEATSHRMDVMTEGLKNDTKEILQKFVKIKTLASQTV